MGKTKILFIDDDTVLGNVVTMALEEAGYETYYQTSLVAFGPVVRELRPDLVILDVAIGTGDGIEVAARLRGLLPNIPVLFVSSHTDGDHVARALEAGGIAYLKKPFGMEELLAYVKRHTALPASSGIRLGSLLFDPAAHTLSRDGCEERKLSRTESRLLALLAAHLNQTVGRDEIIQELWNDSGAHEQSLNNFVAHLRKYLSSEPALDLLAIPRVGYQLKWMDLK